MTEPVILTKWYENTSYINIESSPDKPLFFYIPGNPGLSEYYREYLTEMHRKAPGLEYVVLNHLGCDPNAITPGTVGDRTYTLEEQVRHKIEFLRQYVSQPRQVFILGHSVGSWIAQRVAAAFLKDPTVQVRFLGLMTPTIKDIAASERGQWLLWISEKLGPTAVTIGTRFLQSLYYTMPLGAYRAVVRSIMPRGVSEHTINTTVSMLQRPAILRQIMVMGYEEMASIGPDLEPSEITGLWSSTLKMWVFFVQHDHWVHNDTRSFLIDNLGHLPNVETEIAVDPSIVHAYCVAFSRPVADHTIDVLQRFKLIP